MAYAIGPLVKARGREDVHHFTDTDVLDAEPVLSGFTCPAARLFPKD